ncbi:Lrp/AsnC family transcriptional regulator [Trinickia terrae]|uniref:Lrp/AsnC family transcriptional regulator n=2 Tax=Trinickia terrae TaxID=2571161 RepID=A0A4U1HYW6_9BURK|nr:Lrp/AsnC family transcriptional regulator [Trinickia terrae]
MRRVMLDTKDVQILDALQKDGRLTNAELAQSLGMSASPCWRRVQRLEQIGVIRGYRAEVDRQRVGLGVLAFVRVSIDSYSEVEASRFAERMQGFEHVVACYQVAGEVDFLLQVVAADLDSYESTVVDLRRIPGIRSMHTMFVLNEIKAPAGLPVRATLEDEA